MIKKIVIKNPKDDVENIRYNTIDNFSEDIIKKVGEIIGNVRKDGDDALKKYTYEYDRVMVDSIRVNKDEIKDAYKQVTDEQVKTIYKIRETLIENDVIFLEHIKKISSLYSNNRRIKRFVQPISSVGCYIPGGLARYPSTLVMCATPAKLAGVKRLVAISPPQKNGNVDPLTLVAADICGINEFYKVGGAQGIAALAFGTHSIKSVDKIVGPGGIFVTMAKLLVSNKVSIDMMAGPTELVIYASSETNPRYVALDLVSQAEHSKDTLCGVVTNSLEFADKVQNEVNKILKKNISRKEFVSESLNKNGFIAIAENDDLAIDFVNEIAPEHLQIMSIKELNISRKINSAGLILIGENTPSSASDYCLGSNHVLPTMGFGKSRASLSVLDFIRFSTIIKSNKNDLKKIEPFIKIITQEEGLVNHYEAFKERLTDISQTIKKK
ncbi:MAG TPA: histidinol dehydrogenase [Nitrososphaeraceae archaeon]|nr:histidinol dehydrogenase [Nitrososphaeraceae archaeon]